jgi:hypothetical protein
MSGGDSIRPLFSPAPPHPEGEAKQPAETGWLHHHVKGDGGLATCSLQFSVLLEAHFFAGELYRQAIFLPKKRTIVQNII